MSYTVEIMKAGPISPDGEMGTEMYQLPDPYETVAGAKEAAEQHIVGLGVDAAAVVYNVFDREGFTVASNAEPLAEAS